MAKIIESSQAGFLRFLQCWANVIRTGGMRSKSRPSS